MNTIVFEKNEQGMEFPVDIFSKMTQSRTIFLNGYLDDKKATDIVATLLYLRSQTATDPTINIFMDLDAIIARNVLMITDMMESLKDIPIRVVAIGRASGLAPLLLAAADESQAGANSAIFVQPFLPMLSKGKVSELNAHIKRAKNDYKKISSIYAKKLGISLKEAEEFTEKETFLNGKSAVKLGLIDSVLGAK